MIRILLILLLSVAFPAIAAGPSAAITFSPLSPVTAPANVTVRVRAMSSGDGVGIDSIVLTRNGVVIPTPAGDDFTVSQSGLAVGSYAYKAVVTDTAGLGKTVTQTLLVTASNPPTVSLAVGTGPFVGPATVPLSATASDSDGTVARVDFVVDNAVVGSDSTAPYAFNWTNVQPGNYVVSAHAYDNTGVRTISSAKAVFVKARPTVAMVVPAPNQVLQAGAAAQLSATAKDIDDGIERVEFHVDGVLVGQDFYATSSYTPQGALVQTYSYGYSGAPGSHSVLAKAYDEAGNVVTSSTVSFQLNAAPTVAITSPLNGDAKVGPATFNVEATATDAGGTVASVKFYVDGVLKATDTSAPYTYSLVTSATGIRTIEAVATDTQGGVSTASVFVTVNPNTASTATTLSRKFVYDLYERLCKVIEPETGATTTQYDEAGNVIWTAAGLDLPDPMLCNRGDLSYLSGRRVDRTYDARNRIKTLTFPDGRGNLTYDYGADGQLAAVTTHNNGVDKEVVTTTYAYNRRGLLDVESMKFGITNPIDWPIDYAYTANGHLASQTYHGLLVDYAPNALGQPTKAGTFARDATYYPNGAIKTFTYGNGIVHRMLQNARGLPGQRCDSLTAGAPGVCNSGAVLHDTYRYDRNGNVAQIIDGRLVNGIWHRGDRTMSYDDLDRLTRTDSTMFGSGTEHAATYTYDVLDNLTGVTVNSTVSVPGRDWKYYYDGNWRLTNVLQATTGATVMGLGYDVQGNLSDRNGRAFDFDYGNRLRGVAATSAAPAVAYLYDGLGRRIRDYNTSGPAGSALGTRYSQYSLDGKLVQSADNRTNIFAEYAHLGDVLVAIHERDSSSGSNVYTTKYQHADGLGSPVAVTNSTGGIVQRSEYEPYGKVLMPVPASDGPGYTGHVLDAATGMNYMQQRYYDPEIGRFLSVDPISGGMGDHFNRYWYGNNNPYRYIDPDGRESQLAKAWGWLNSSFQEEEMKNCFPHGCSIEQMRAMRRDDRNRQNISMVINAIGGWSGESAAGALSKQLPRMLNSGRARSSAIQFARLLKQYVSNASLPRAVAAVVDRTTGISYFGASGEVPRYVHPSLSARMPAESLEIWSVENCAEFNAVNRALYGGAKYEDLEVHTVLTKSEEAFKRCQNCKITTDGVRATSD